MAGGTGGRTPWATSGFQGQGQGSKSFLTARIAFPSRSEACLVLLFLKTHQPRTGPRREKRGEKGLVL